MYGYGVCDCTANFTAPQWHEPSSFIAASPRRNEFFCMMRGRVPPVNRRGRCDDRRSARPMPTLHDEEGGPMPSIALHVNGEARTVEVDDRERAAALRPAQHAGPHRRQVRLRPRTVRRMHGADRRRGRALLRASGLARRGPQGDDRRGPGRAGKAASVAGGLRHRAGGAMRLLRHRHGDDGRGAARKEAQRYLEEAKEALAGNLCRCGTHQRILRAMMRAAGRSVT